MGKNKIAAEYQNIRQKTLSICADLEAEDCAIQPRSYVSPPKWHLGHTTWFFEELVLKKLQHNYRNYNSDFSFLFNSYYNSFGDHNTQNKRGFFSRPTLKEIIQYRAHIDNILIEILSANNLIREQEFLIRVGLNHEQQHQELLYMDIKFILSHNLISYLNIKPITTDCPEQESWFISEGGLQEIGCGNKADFSYDNENPRHKVYLYPFEISNELVSNRDYLIFINDRGYDTAGYWLSLGWNYILKNNIRHPLYWKFINNKWYEYTLFGLQELDLNSPVVHLSYYEADAYASYKNARLPSEFELEIFLNAQPSSDTHEHHLHPLSTKEPRRQVWCWTKSAYGAYPGFRPFEHALFEYNKKFMCNQYVLKGGSVVTPVNHYRDSYRNFYEPHQRWMFSGIRLAQDRR